MLADSFGSKAEAYFCAGEFDQSLQHSQQALQITTRIENAWGQSYDQMLMAFIYLERGELGRGIQLSEQSIQLAERAGLIASGIGLRSELAWIYSYCGALDRGLDVIDKAVQMAETKQVPWKAMPQAAKVRMYLLQGDVQSAEQAAGDKLLEPISIPYARYTIFLSLANIELAVAKSDYSVALALTEDLLAEVSPLTPVDIPDVLRWKAKALLGLGRDDKALQVLMEARSRAEELGCNFHLWPILAELADVNTRLENPVEAQAHREGAHRILQQIVESLRELELSESFQNQPQIQRLIKA
jgi:tetratricopeptide (TPR) repeat protein